MLYDENLPPVNFYKLREEYGCFSNFSRHEVEVDGRIWKTSEHYFQAMKFYPHRPDLVDAVFNCKTPSKAAQMGRDRSNPLREDWEDVKETVMLQAVYSKFQQNEEIKKVLLGTDDRKLVEHTVNDSYWGDGGDGSGKNRLGHILMKVRQLLRTTTAKILWDIEPQQVNASDLQPLIKELGDALGINILMVSDRTCISDFVSKSEADQARLADAEGKLGVGISRSDSLIEVLKKMKER